MHRGDTPGPGNLSPQIPKPPHFLQVVFSKAGVSKLLVKVRSPTSGRVTTLTTIFESRPFEHL